MVNFKPFAVEQWMDDYQPGAKYDLAETCVASISVEELQTLSDNKSSPLSLNTKLTYGEIRGSTKLRSCLAGLYSSKAPKPLPINNVLVTPGAIAANHLVLTTLIQPGDHVICQYPTYQQLYSVPEALGAEVSLWKSNEKDKWRLDIAQLKESIKANTKLIIINNPQNPTGAIVPRSQLEEVVEIAREHGLTILSDEVYRPLFHSIGPADPNFPPSLLSLGYEKAVVTGSLSKAYSLAGIRVGWIASKSSEIMESCAMIRHYTNISVAQLDDQIASYALSSDCIHNLLGRNIGIAKKNKELVEKFVEEFRWACSWAPPVAGTTAFIKFSQMGKPVDDVAFCKALQEKTGAFVAPGSYCFGGNTDFKGYVRIGYCCETKVLQDGLDAIRSFMEDEYEKVPRAK